MDLIDSDDSTDRTSAPEPALAGNDSGAPSVSGGSDTEAADSKGATDAVDPEVGDDEAPAAGDDQVDLARGDGARGADSEPEPEPEPEAGPADVAGGSPGGDGAHPVEPDLSPPASGSITSSDAAEPERAAGSETDAPAEDPGEGLVDVSVAAGEEAEAGDGGAEAAGGDSADVGEASRPDEVEAEADGGSDGDGSGVAAEASGGASEGEARSDDDGGSDSDVEAGAEVASDGPDGASAVDAADVEAEGEVGSDGADGGVEVEASGSEVEGEVGAHAADAVADVDGAEAGSDLGAEARAGEGDGEPGVGAEAEGDVGLGAGVGAEAQAGEDEREGGGPEGGGGGVDTEPVEAEVDGGGGDVDTEVAEGEADGEGRDVDTEPVVVGVEPQRERWRWRVGSPTRVALVVGVVVVLLLGVVGGWVVDMATSSGQVARNVELAGQAVGGLDEQALRQVVTDLAEAEAGRAVTIRSGPQGAQGLQRAESLPGEQGPRQTGAGATYTSTAAELGLTVDVDATVDAALDAGRDGSPLGRPFRWLASVVSPHDVPLHYTVDEARTAVTLEALQGDARTAPVEPTMPVTEAGFVVVPGQLGSGIDPAAIADQLVNAAEAADADPDDALVIDTEPTRLDPRLSDAEVQALADRGNAMTAAGLNLTAGPATASVSAEQLRAWIHPTLTEEGRPDLALDGEAVTAALPDLLGPVGDPPVNATVTLDPAGTPVVVPGHNGVRCCQDDSAVRIWDALNAGAPGVELAVQEAEPGWTTEEVQSWGITQPVGGNRAWRSGHEEAGPAPGFTTYHDCCASRVTNIHRLADLVRGAVVPPGGDFSINDYVGPRTAANGFVLAGAIAEGHHVDEIGGGVSQFATTTFNAAYFAGLDITSYQAHTEYFSRYPRGREATMGYPAPDLAFHNNTPYGILIWTSYTGTSLTVTLYSTPWATAEQTGISESSNGACRNVTTTRTRTFPDGTVTQDQFRATYRPGEGRFC